jgi:dipeptidyl aminopeptidase/acylaminoacyl peptidase
VPGESLRETLTFKTTDPSDLIFLYRPTQIADRKLPVLLAVYPGPVDTWECVSIGLAQAGYAVLAIGPAYGLELTHDVDTLERLITMVKNGGVPGTDPDRVAALGGSYSALLLELLMLRDPGLNAVVLLGPPTDMFDFRRRFERDGFVPPFGLGKALVALGLPSREPLRYLNHSMVYQTRSDLPATIIFHSYQDEIVPYQQSGLLAESLRKHGVEAELHLFDGASHYLLEDSAAADAIYYQTLDFLRRHGMPPFPGKEK